ncbi:MAG TPA: chemotaxis protein CheW, partial [Candidatus Wallbacteria bacterium]|nr:chemotaxis protein CheW [Candidatus Wallbacteria bacterium]
ETAMQAASAILEELESILEHSFINIGVPREENRDSDYLSFVLNDEECAIEMRYVSEVIAIPEISSIAGAPGYVKGSINYRGKSIPVIDLRIRFGIDAAGDDDYTSIIVVNHDNFLMGVIVDRVSEVVEINPEAIERPGADIAIDNEAVLGIGRIYEKMKILLNAAALIPCDEAKKFDTLMS